MKHKRSRDFWKLERRIVTSVYTFDTVEDSPHLCTVTVKNGTVIAYTGVFALDAEIVRKLEKDGVIVPKSCR